MVKNILTVSDRHRLIEALKPYEESGIAALLYCERCCNKLDKIEKGYLCRCGIRELKAGS